MGDTASPELTPTLPPGLPDDWVLDRDLPCPKCRYNLRMLCLPRCPECGTVFCWQTLLHIGCPRCGESLETVDGKWCPRCDLDLDWRALLDKADPSQFKQFEYTQRPVRAAFRAWLGALRPRRFWQGIRLESPPALTRLRWLLATAIGLYVVAAAAARWEGSILFRVVGGGVLDDPWVESCIAAALMPIVTMIGLPLFVPTLVRFRIRRDQLFRCFAYGSTGLAWMALAIVLAGVVVVVVNFLPGPRAGGRPPLMISSELAWGCLLSARTAWWNSAENVCLNCFLLGTALFFNIACWWPFLWMALHKYLRLNRRNALALFFSTQSVAVLAAAIVLIQDRRLQMIVGSLLNQIGS